MSSKITINLIDKFKNSLEKAGIEPKPFKSREEAIAYAKKHNKFPIIITSSDSTECYIEHQKLINMKYIIAILHTILLIVMPLIIIPTLQWYKRTFCEPNTNLSGYYFLLFLMSLGALIMTIIRWGTALKNDENITL